MELWENGALIRAGAENDVPDGGLLFTLTWDAAELADATGSGVECKIVGTQTRGGTRTTGNREERLRRTTVIPQTTVEVGAVKWTTDVSASLTPIVGGKVGRELRVDGTHSQTIEAGSGGPPELILRAKSNFVGTIDNVTIKQSESLELFSNDVFEDVPQVKFIFGANIFSYQAFRCKGEPVDTVGQDVNKLQENAVHC